MNPSMLGHSIRLLLGGWAVFMLLGCGTPPQGEAGAQAQGGRSQEASGPASVDVAIAQAAALQDGLEFTGTTQPYRQVSLRSQVEGQLLSLLVNVGDPVTQGQTLAQLDGTVLTTAVLQAQAQVDSLKSEVAQAQAQISEAQRQAAAARLSLQQAKADLTRFESLYREGAIAQQQVEQSRTATGTAQQAVNSAEAVVQSRIQARDAAQRRVVAQEAVVARERERQSYSTLRSPVTGVVLERVSEPGNLAQAGGELLKLGDFSQVKILVQVSELALPRVRVGQSVQVKLDAFPKQSFSGQVSRISPVADPTARLIPVEITMPNPSRQLGSGLLARVRFGGQSAQAIVVPESALQINRQRGNRSGGGNRPGGGGSAASQARRSPAPSSPAGRSASPNTPSESPSTGTLYLVQGNQGKTKVVARSVTLGQRRDGQVEVLSGLRAGDRYVARSARPLKTGDPVQLSILSEPSRS